jgi:hypothetical protein
MRLASAVVLLLLYLLAATELQEMVRLPALFEHFAEHKQKNKDVNFLGLIVLHYFVGDSKDSDYQHHQQLPFKEGHYEEASASIIIPVESFDAPLRSIPYTLIKMETYASLFNSASFQFTIWQPPRS